MAYKFNPFTAKLEEYGPVLTGTGTVSAAADGTAALPGIAFTNDLNTGIYRPGADQVAISTNGTGRLFVDATGLVGIGTSAPAAIFSSKPSASSTTAATTFTGDGLFIDCANTTDGNGNYGGAISWSRSASSTTRAAAITNVQTGSDSDVQGLAFLTHASATSTAPLIEAMRITGAGLVGIGTTNPTAPLTVIGVGVTARFQSGAASDGRVEFAYNTTDVGYISASDANTFSLWARSGNALSLGAGATERARIDSSGRLGIGVTDPSSYNSAASNLVIGSTTANSGLTIRSGATGVADRAGSIYFADGTTGNEAFRGFIDYTHSSDALGIGTSGLTRLVIDSSGRLGIGTSDPGSFNAVGNRVVIGSGSGNQGATIFSGSTSTSSLIFAGSVGGTQGQIFYRHNDNSFGFITNTNVSALNIDSSGRLLVGTSTNTGGALFQVNDNRIRVATAKTPASATDTGSAGEICWDANYIYVCTATNTWKRSAIATW